MKTIGRFREIYDGNHPAFKELISQEPIKDKARIIAYLRRGQTTAAAAGVFRDIFSNEPIPGEALWQNDGEYDWRSDTAYYVEKYNMNLPEDFVKKATGRRSV